jgi:hypothetical protein
MIVRLCMSPRLWGNVCTPLGSTPCLGLSLGGIVSTLLIFLVIKISRRFQVLLSRLHFWEFIVFFDFGILCMHLNHMSVQCLESTMDHSLSKVEAWLISKQSCNQPIWAKIGTNSVWLGILQIIQNPWRIRGSCNYKSCSKFHLPPRIFLEFFSSPRYFFQAMVLFWALYKSRNSFQWGPLVTQLHSFTPGPTCQTSSYARHPCRGQKPPYPIRPSGSPSSVFHSTCTGLCRADVAPLPPYLSLSMRPPLSTLATFHPSKRSCHGDQPGLPPTPEKRTTKLGRFWLIKT